MSGGRLGLEVTPTHLRGVWASRWFGRPSPGFSIAWDGHDAGPAVDRLRREHPVPSSIAVAVGLGFLEVGHADLPPAADEVREEMLALDPSRFLASNAPLQVALAPGSAVAHGCDRAWLDRLVQVLEGWAPVVRVEAAPVALAAVAADGAWSIDAGVDERGVVTVSRGCVSAVRRGAAVPEAPRPAAPGTVAPEAVVAWGALAREDDTTNGTLMDAPARTAAHRRRRLGIVTAALAATTGFLLLIAAVDRSRQRTHDALQQEVTRLREAAGPAIAARETELARARAAHLAAALIGARPDPATALAALGQLLPRDVVISAVRVKGRDWQVDGTARDAAALLPLLDAAPRLDSVRSLGASARFRDGRETRESFSIAFRVAADD